MAADTLIFDLDGTLWDSYPWYATILHAQCGVAHEITLGRLREGSNVIKLAEESGLSRTRLIRSCGNHLGSLNLYPDAREVLSALSDRGVKMGVVTNLSKAIAGPILAGLDISFFFESFIYAAKKPSPSGILKAAAELDHTTGEVYYIGDTASDGEAAKRAGVPFAWAGFGYSNEALIDAAVILPDFQSILDL